MDTIRKLADKFAKFPGNGPRQSLRFVYYLLGLSQSELSDLSESISTLKKRSYTCVKCNRYFEKKHIDNNLCFICGDNQRTADTLMVVAKDTDIDSVERGGVYKGYYFVVGGTIPILEKAPKKIIRFNELQKTIQSMIKDGLSEIILAFNLTPEGEYTVEWLGRELEPAIKNTGIKISTLGRGLSTGLELEYSDGDTIKHAISNRYRNK